MVTYLQLATRLSGNNMLSSTSVILHTAVCLTSICLPVAHTLVKRGIIWDLGYGTSQCIEQTRVHFWLLNIVTMQLEVVV